ncbi:MAG: ABC transporter ATP-binding protein [Candidatus Thorarchaeota archaeon]|nr:MAG: ABC transporter ATP-binding protein [Candidatus Thorarchaeota archaeon]
MPQGGLTIYAVELENISKTFPGGVEANKNITLRIREGEVHGLLGENGAGKSTLMNILYGFLSKDTGRILIRGEEVELQSPQDAILRGVGMVHQHFKLIPPLTVTENVILGLEPVLKRLRAERLVETKHFSSLLPIDFRGAADRIRRIAEENGLHIDPDAKIQDISVGLQQRVEIIKTLYRNADIVILDEPTSVLTPQEVDDLFVTLEKFKEAGRTIILITHKLREPMVLADRISVLRDGELIGTVNKEDTSPEELARMMVGRPVVFRVEKGPANPGGVVLAIKDLTVQDKRGITAVRGINLEVKAGEILGIAGVEGNGQTELVEAIAGLLKSREGNILLNGKDITGLDPREVREAGVSHIPEDRHRRGLILGFTIAENSTLGRHHRAPFAMGPGRQVLDLSEADGITEALVDTYSIKVSDIHSLASTLSGGNQQKVIVARELSANPKLILAAQPTRGLDVGATEYIHNVLVSMRDEGAAILLVSAELDEIMSVSDRIAVIFDGQIVAVKEPEATTAEELGLLMAGHKQDQSSAEAVV